MNNLSKVQKKKKNNKLAPFWIFAHEFRSKLKLSGVPVHGDRQLQEMAAPHWAKLSIEEKEKYKNKSKNLPLTAIPTPRKIYNSLGQDIEVVEAKKVQDKEECVAVIQEIKMMIDEAYGMGEMDDLVYYFMNTTAFIETGDDIFPAEIALAKFSLKKGIFDELQIRINPGELPMGSAYQASEHAKKYHNYPLPPNCDGESDYLSVLESILKFLHPFDKLPIFFTEGNWRDDKKPLEITRKIVEKIFYESQEDDLIDDVKIYPVVELLFLLQGMNVRIMNGLNEKCDARLPSVVYAEHEMKKGCFDFSTVGCTFHHELDKSPNCCLSKVRRYGYTVAKWCCNKIKYPLIEGAHFPDGYQAT